MSGSVERGFLLLTISYIIFFLSGYVIYFALGRLLTVEDFGVYGVIISLISFLNLVLITGIRQSVAKFVSETPQNAETIRWKALKAQVLVGMVIAVVYFLIADLIALALNDIALSPFIKLSAIVLFIHPLFSIHVGYFNGLKNFKLQSVITSLYYILKVLLIVGLVFFGFGLYGAIGGFFIASFIALFIALPIAQGKAKKTKVKIKWKEFKVMKLFKFAVPVLVFSSITNFLLNIGVFAVKALSPAENANALTGYFTAATTLSHIPFFIMLSFSAVLFPLVSEKTFAKDINKARFYINNGLRYSLLVLAPIFVLIASTAKELITLFYTEKFVPGAESLVVLSIAFTFFSFFLILTTVITAANRPKLSTLIAFVILVVNLALNFTLIPQLGIMGAAIASAISLFVGFAVAMAFIFAKFKAFFSLLTIARTIIAGAIVFIVSVLIPVEGLILVGKYVLLIAVYSGVLLLLKEISKKDFAVFYRMLKTRHPV